MKEIKSIKKEINNRSGRLKYLLSFILPCLIVLFGFSCIQVHPFGDRMILTVDCYHQYVPFLIEFRNKLLSGDSLFYTWNGGLGTEYYAAFANYSASPLNLLSVFFTAKTMPDFVLYITCLRAGLASLFMTIFLSDSEKRNPDFITISFAVMYALCGWFLTDFWNIMWCDAILLLPLICYGLRRLLHEGRYVIYVVSLFAALFSNYYTGYFICLFLVFYAPIMYFTEFKTRSEANDSDKDIIGVKSFFIAAGRFAFASLIAGAMSAIITLPTYFILQNSSATGSELTWDFKLQDTLFDFFARFMVAANPNIRDGMANVYSGSLAVILVPLFFMAPAFTNIKKREKVLYAALLGLLYFSFTNRTLIFIWHGFHFPNQIPHRESFLMSFLLVIIAFRVVRNIRAFEAKTISWILFFSVAFVILYEKMGDGNESYIQYILSLIFIPSAALVLQAIRNNKKQKPAFYVAILTAFVFIEYILVTPVVFFTIAKNEVFPTYDFYAKNDKLIYETANEINSEEGHMLFERTEIYPNSICCEQSVYNVKGLSTFSSTARESFVKYLANFGLHNNGINSVRTAGISKPTATILGIRNTITKELNDSAPLFFDKVRDVNDLISVYENPDALSVGFMVSEDLLQFEHDNTTDAFLHINSWIRSMGVEADVFNKISATSNEVTGATLTGSADDIMIYNVTGGEKFVFDFNVSNATVGSDVYVYANANFGGMAKVIVGENTNNFEIRSNQIISLGTFTGEPIQVILTYNSPKNSVVKYYFYELNQDGYEEMLATLGDEQLEVTNYDSTSIEGTINVNEDGLLFLSIPYSEGFKAYVDGNETEITPIEDALCSIRLTSGTHQIRLVYVPRYFNEAAIITTAAAVVFIITIVLSGYLRNKKDRKIILSDTVEPSKIEGDEVINKELAGDVNQPANTSSNLSIEEVEISAEEKTDISDNK